MRRPIFYTFLLIYLPNRIVHSGIIHAIFGFVRLVIDDIRAYWRTIIRLLMTLILAQSRWLVGYLIYWLFGIDIMSSLPLDLLVAILLYYVVTVHLLPFTLARFTTLRCAVISPLRLTLEGVEWSTRRAANRLPPSLRFEEVYLGRGQSRTAASGIFVFVVKGVTVRADHWRKVKCESAREPKARNHKSWLSTTIGSFTVLTSGLKMLAVWVLSLVIHHYPFVARVFSIEVKDIRVIFDSMDGLETTIDDVHLGLRILFDPSANPLKSPSGASTAAANGPNQPTPPRQPRVADRFGCGAQEQNSKFGRPAPAGLRAALPHRMVSVLHLVQGYRQGRGPDRHALRCTRYRSASSGF